MVLLEQGAQVLFQYRNVVSEPVIVEHSQSGENSDIWKVLIMQNGQMSYVLKAAKIWDSEWRMAMQLWVAAKYNWPHVPDLYTTKDDHCYILDGARIWSLWEYVPGVAVAENRVDAEKCARALAILHKEMIPNALGVSHSDLYGDLADWEIRNVQTLLHIQEDTEWKRQARIAVKNLPKWYAAVNGPIEKAKSDLPPVRCCLIDYRPGNVVMALADGQPYCVDWDIASVHRMQAVAFAASRFCPIFPGIFLEAYNEIDPLTKAEWDLYPIFVKRNALGKINWLLRVNVLMGQNAWREDFGKHLEVLCG